MKKVVVTVFLLLVFGSGSTALPLTHASDLTLHNTPARACFNPHGGCIEAIVKELNGARTEILMEAYSFKRDSSRYSGQVQPVSQVQFRRFTSHMGNDLHQCGICNRSQQDNDH